MGMKLKDVKTLKLIPQWMRNDEAIQSLAKACDELFQTPASRIVTIRTWDQIDQLNNDELDEMAWELDVDWWQSSWPIDRKRATIKVASRVKEKRGTKWAVEQLITAAFGVGEVNEWFKYGGEPYFFKIKTNATLTEDGMETFLSMIERVKSARSHVDTIEVERTITQSILTGCAANQSMKNVIVDIFAVDTVASVTTYQTAGSYSWSKSPAIMEKFDELRKVSNAIIAGVGNGWNFAKNTIKEE